MFIIVLSEKLIIALVVFFVYGVDKHPARNHCWNVMDLLTSPIYIYINMCASWSIYMIINVYILNISTNTSDTTKIQIKIVGL